ncbi:hypothetical protein H5410_035614 [Solanum commersonii]|uniref:Uncharacterized protein n=1 Tax=Solanum commersonii TaxID=4109 RepID=A0A9J5Y5P0_SOLCO|nr:hypothetical protein H5410_035614 [Solanum commersonii]
MSKKTVVTPRKSPRLVEGTFTDEVHAPSFNRLTQISPPKNVETPARGKKRKGKIVETPSYFDSDFVSESKKKKTTNVEVAQSSKPSTRRTTKKKELEISRSKKDKKVVRTTHIT